MPVYAWIWKIAGSQAIRLIEKLTDASAEIRRVPQNAFTVSISELEDGNIGVGGKARGM